MEQTPELLRRETRLERYDRNWNELLQELRVMQTGVQILFGFLLVLPFQARFPELGPWGRALYLFVFGCVALSTVCNVAPAAAHRLAFQRSRKPELVKASSQWAKLGLVFLAFALIGASTLVVHVLHGLVAGLIAGGTLLAAITVLWVVMPLRIVRREGSSS